MKRDQGLGVRLDTAEQGTAVTKTSQKTGWTAPDPLELTVPDRSVWR